MADQFVDAVVVFGGPKWNRVLRILPVAEMRKMDDGESRHPLFFWRLGNGTEFFCKCTTSLEFQRWGNSTKYRFKASGHLTEDGKPIGKASSWDVNLSSRATWATEVNKMKGSTSSVRVVGINLSYSEGERRDNDVVRVEAVVPVTSDVDKGKVLKKCVDWGKTVVDGNIQYRELVQELPIDHEIKSSI
ncbi:hypothetical protein SEMRO_1401_G269430.1 [Seminavis robusta]|uniref:Uncharacterized protein n=1 Tax=Seminavis robusta TaxID=568900 RepID=A0A9N8ERE1_9STRA|nr:hypothetical protein SEMRO_1401_G269430.1 [Seminavis robusta]|eukprot:Sro1401_g269430.1 n/a (189) ;mRNA; f:8261-8827